MTFLRSTGLAAALATAAVILCASTPSAAGAAPSPVAFEAYVRPYVEGRNFMGAVLVVKDGKVLFERAYGDAGSGRPNTPATRFRIASMSMQFTAAAVMRLVDQGKLSLSTPVSAVVEGIPNGDKITVRDLLEEVSGLADLNGFPEYAGVLQQHQTAASLVDAIRGKPPAHEPGGTYKAEEHSAYNLLALIVEKKTGLPFAKAVGTLVFKPLGMTHSGVDDDGPAPAGLAKGYATEGVRGVVPATPIRWSAKTGNASAWSTVGDERRWIEGLFGDRFLRPASRAAVLDYSARRVGYGWFKSLSKRFGVAQYYMNGRAPGFAAFAVEMPSEHLTVVVLGDLYASTTTTIGFDLTAIALGKPYTAPPRVLAGVDVTDLAGAYRFGPNFYQPGATLKLDPAEGGATLHWPDGDVTALIPTGKDRFIDRAYWVELTVERDAQGRVVGVSYDGMKGVRVEAETVGR